MVLLLLLPVILAFLGGIAAFLIRQDRPRHFVVSVAVFSAAAAAVLLMFFRPEDITLLSLGGTLSLRFGLDETGAFFLLTDSLVWCFVQFHAFGYMRHEGGDARFSGFYCLTYGALLALAMAKNAVTLYMCFELMTLLSMPLVLHNGSARARSGAVKYLGYSCFGAALALMGFFLLASGGASLVFSPGGISFSSGSNSLLLSACFLIVLGFGCKAGLVPLQMWLTEAHPVAPSPASAVLSGVITKGGVLAILRVVFYLIGADVLRGTWVQETLKTLAIVTVFTGSILALREKILKRRLAYSTISQVSYVLFGLFTLNVTGFTGAMLQILFHALAKNILFLAAGSIIFSTGFTRVDELKGIGRKMPVTMWCFAIASLSLIGIPPTGGFVSKWFLAMGALEAGSAVDFAGLVILMLSALMTAFYLLPIVTEAFFPGRDFHAGDYREVEPKMLLPVVVFSALVLVFGILPGGFSQWFSSIAERLL